jgi:hypothetical protein
MPYASQLDIMGDDGFLRRTRIALLVSAMENSASSTPKIQQLSAAVLNNSDGYLTQFGQALCAKIPNLSESTSDADVQAAIGQIFPMIAGV